MSEATTKQTAGQLAYEAYFMTRDGDAGDWHELTDEQRVCWEAAGDAAASCENRPSEE